MRWVAICVEQISEEGGRREKIIAEVGRGLVEGRREGRVLGVNDPGIEGGLAVQFENTN